MERSALDMENVSVDSARDVTMATWDIFALIVRLAQINVRVLRLVWSVWLSAVVTWWRHLMVESMNMQTFVWRIVSCSLNTKRS